MMCRGGTMADWMSTFSKELITILSALLVPTLAIAGGIIAWLQWRTNERKRKQDLFDRRFALYLKAVSYYEEIWSEQAGTSPDYDWKTLYVEASFLFGPDIEAHLETMNRNEKFDIRWFALPFRRYMQLK
jgi:hypothetical protein